MVEYQKTGDTTMKALFVTAIPEEKKADFSLDGVDITFKERNKVTLEDLKDTEIVLGNLPYALLSQAPSVKWVQLDSAGVGELAKLNDGVALTNASGAYGEAISEHMLGCVLAMMKNLYHYYDQQRERSWNNLGSVNTISNSTVLSVGMGDIGSSFARKMHALGAQVYGIRRTVHDTPDYLKALGTMEDLDTYLPMADVVALSLPETKDTIHLFTEERLRKMKKGALLINVGRGSAIDTQSLIKVMQDHYLGGVDLDVTEWEPLPKNHALWNMQNVYITPHISGRFNASVTYDKVLQIFHDNLVHYINKESLEHLVDKKAGY
jgi:phosphoglycerate dehydrogenase-like enzyme